MNRLLASLALLCILTGCNAASQPSSPAGESTTSSQSRRESRERTRSEASESASAGSFDYYLLNLSWSPEYCYSHRDAQECAQHSTIVLHGLWPQNNTGSYPENCSDTPGPTDPSKYADLYPEASLLEHEWKTHGTCSGLTPDAYFGLVRSVYRSVAMPPLLTRLNHEISLQPVQLLNLVQDVNPTFPPGSVALSCGNNYLTAIEVCMNKHGQAIACGPIRSCRANSIRIPAPQ